MIASIRIVIVAKRRQGGFGRIHRTWRVKFTVTRSTSIGPPRGENGLSLGKIHRTTVVRCEERGRDVRRRGRRLSSPRRYTRLDPARTAHLHILHSNLRKPRTRNARLTAALESRFNARRATYVTDRRRISRTTRLTVLYPRYTEDRGDPLWTYPRGYIRFRRNSL